MQSNAAIDEVPSTFVGKDDMEDEMKRKWYLTLMATAYLVICTAGCVYYALLYVRPDAGTVPVFQQVLCLGFCVAAFLYLTVPKIGCTALTVLTAATLIAIGTSNPGATVFHGCVLLLLLVAQFAGHRPQPHHVRRRPSGHG